LVLWLHPLFQALTTPPERHQEINQEVPGRPGSWGPPWNLLVSLLMSLRGSCGSFKKGVEPHNQLLPEGSRYLDIAYLPSFARTA
jgi:hypothetical protein